MNHLTRRLATLGVAGSLATGAIVAGALPAVAKTVGTPEILVTQTTSGHHTTYAYSGSHTVPAGRIKFKVIAKGAESDMQVASFNKGYSFAKLESDLATFGKSEGEMGPSKSGLAALKRAIKGTELWAGYSATSGHKASGTTVLPKGNYVLYFGSDAPKHPIAFTVTQAAGTQSKLKVSSIAATKHNTWAGAKTLPASGTLGFRNQSDYTPHFLELDHVKKGTTKKQVLEAIESESEAPPSFILKGTLDTELVGPGHQATVNYTLPAGTYVELCFFPDPKTGMPHAFMGMIGFVTLK
jgi:hypothetical protein